MDIKARVNGTYIREFRGGDDLQRSDFTSVAS